MLKKLTPIFLVVFFSLSSTRAENQQAAADRVFELPEVVVTATRTEVKILDAPAHVTFITKEDIRAMGAKNIADVLSLQSGITLRDYGSEGALKSVSVRGARSSGVLVLIDGTRLNDSRKGGMDLSLIPLHIIERIEIVRGGTSALYGADAVGGIINIITKKSTEKPFSIRIENGSYIPRKAVKVSESGEEEVVDPDPLDLLDTQKVTLGFSHKADRAEIVASGSLTKARNAFVWNDSEYIDEYRKRVNADMRGGDLYTGVSIPHATGRWDVTGFFAYDRKGVPGSLVMISDDATQDDLLARGQVGYKSDEFLSRFLTLDIRGFYTFSSLKYEDPDLLFPVDDLHKIHTVGLDASQQLLSFDAFSLVYGFNLLYDAVDSTQIGTEKRTSGGFFVEVPLSLSPRLSVIPVVRYDAYSDFPNNLNYKLSGVYNVSNSTSLKAAVSKSYRAPTLNDLYWPSGPWTSGNPNLKPETGYNAEIGITSMKEKLSVDLFAFVRYMRDEIHWSQGDDFIYRPSNIGETVYPGIEGSGSLNFLKHLWLNINYTFLYSFVLKGTDEDYDISDDRRVPYVPLHSLDCGLEYRGTGHLVSITAQVESKRYTDEKNGESLDAYSVLNAHYERSIREDLTLFLTIKNLLNTNYETAKNYIMPPLSIWTGIEAQF